MAIQAVIFDLYGVLAINGWQAFKAKHFTHRPEVWDQVYELGKRVDAGLADYDDLIRFTAEQSGEAMATVRYQLEHTIANEDLLAYIAGHLKPLYRLGVLTNASNPGAVDTIFSSEQLKLFDTLVFSREVGRVKPDVEIYEIAASRLGVAPEECVFVDDQERHATGARDAGMRAVLYTDFATFPGQLQPLLSDPK